MNSTPTLCHSGLRSWFLGVGCLVLAAANLLAQEKPAVVTVPVGGELARTFDASEVSVHLVSRPFFSPAPSGWPAVEVGPVSLTFIRNTAGGGLVLLGDQPLSLPAVIALDDDGRSRQPLDFTFSYSQPKAAATLTLDGQAFTLAAAAPTGPVAVAVAAGDKNPWVLDTFVVTTTPSTSTATPADTPTPDPNSHSSEPIDADALANAAKLNTDLAQAVARGEQTPAQAIARLKAAPVVGFKFDADADFALAAIRIGETLVGAEKLEEADPFFHSAETALSAAFQRSVKAGEQALCLKHLAWIRAHYLNKEAQAASDIEAAYQLSPKDNSLRDLRSRLSGQRKSS